MWPARDGDTQRDREGTAEPVTRTRDVSGLCQSDRESRHPGAIAIHPEAVRASLVVRSSRAGPPGLSLPVPRATWPPDLHAHACSYNEADRYLAEEETRARTIRKARATRGKLSDQAAQDIASRVKELREHWR